jgi:hypothetical protein
MGFWMMRATVWALHFMETVLFERETIERLAQSLKGPSKSTRDMLRNPPERRIR